MFDSLPERLSNAEIKECFIKLKNTGSEEYREKLIVHNLRLVAKMVYDEFGLMNLDKDDLFSVGTIGLMKAVDTFDVDKGFLFATYATICIRNEILMYFRKEKIALANVNISDIVIYDKDGDEVDYSSFLADEDAEFEEGVCNNIVMQILLSKIESLNERDKLVIKAYFGIGMDKMTQKDISKKLDLSQSYISRIIKNCVKSVRNKLIYEMGRDFSLIKDL